jgi:hypothetical protein
MSVERRLRETLAVFDEVEPAPDLFRRVERSLADDLAWRRHLRRWMAAVVAGVTLAILVVSGVASRSTVGTVVVPGSAIAAVETMVLASIVVVFGPLIRRFGAVFVEDVFESVDIGHAFLRLLDVAYYLVFAGYVILTVPVTDLGGRYPLRELLDTSMDRIGGLLLLMGVMHAATITALPLIGTIHASTVRNQQRLGTKSPSPSTPEAALAERVVRIVLWIAGGSAVLLLAAFLLQLALGIVLGIAD